MLLTLAFSQCIKLLAHSYIGLQGLLTEKIQRAMENKRYQAKRKSASGMLYIKRPKSSSDEGMLYSVGDTVL